MRYLLVLLLAGCAVRREPPAAVLPAALPPLVVAEDGRRLERADGRPFFWLGDTAWELLHRLTRDEIDHYLDNRAAKRFTVVQVVLLPEINGLDLPNRYGELPLVELDPARPNARYFELADYLVDGAAARGLYVALLPTWGAYAVEEDHPLFADHFVFTPETAYPYGHWLGARYRERTNVVWILGGNRFPDGYEPTWRALARGLTEGSDAPPLLTYHPRGPGSSATALHDEPWLDFNMVQSGHDRESRPYALVSDAYGRTPAKPVLNAEPGYEGIPDRLADGVKLTADDVRRFAYWSVFAGAFGHTYGANELWMMWTPAIEPVSALVAPPFLQAAHPWHEAMDYPGAFQMQHLRALVESRPMAGRIPDQGLVASENADGPAHVRAARGADGSYALLYLPRPGQAVAVRLDRLSGPRLDAWWFDPRTGTAQPLPGPFANDTTYTFTAPPDGPDWVLVLDDAARRFAPPGTIRNDP